MPICIDNLYTSAPHPKQLLATAADLADELGAELVAINGCDELASVVWFGHGHHRDTGRRAGWYSLSYNGEAWAVVQGHFDLLPIEAEVDALSWSHRG